MKTIDFHDFKHISTAKLNHIYEHVRKDLRAFAIRLTKLDEAVTLPVGGDLEQQLAELTKRFEAARRGLGFVNKLPAGPQKIMHSRRVMQNLNFIRKALSQTIQAMNSFDKASTEHERSFTENEEASWAKNTLSSIMHDSGEQEFCEYCNCDPCECGHDSSSCPACGSSTMNSNGQEHKLTITIKVAPPEGKESSADDEEVCSECGYNPCECEFADEEVCPECGYDPCECEFADEEVDNEEPEDLNQEEEEECPECDAFDNETL